MFLKTHHLVLNLALLSFSAQALNFSSTMLVLNCPERGNVEVILHVYDHTQEKWKNNFETGAGHKTAGSIDIIPFVNGDTLFHDRRNDSYSYAYGGEGPVRRCIRLTERSLYPVFG